MDSMTVRRERAPRLTAAERREAILAAVEPLIGEHGGELTTRQIAEAAGIAEGTIFRVFADKRALLWAAAERTIRPPGWREDLARALATEPDLDGKVRLAAERMFRRMQQVMAVMMAIRSVLMA